MPHFRQRIIKSISVPLLAAFIAALFFIMPAASGAAAPPPHIVNAPMANGPGRPKIRNNTIYTAWDTPLRGVQIDLAPYDQWVSREFFTDRTIQCLDAVLENGLNAVHAYTDPADNFAEAEPFGFRNCEIIT